MDHRAHTAWLRARVQEIEAVEDAGASAENSLVWGTTRRKSGGEDRGVTEEAAPNIWLRLYQTERTHLVKVCWKPSGPASRSAACSSPSSRASSLRRQSGRSSATSG